MGGSSYDRDVEYSSSSTGFSSGATSSRAAKTVFNTQKEDASTIPENKTITSTKKSPIVIAIDVTGSNIEFARIIYDKAPLLFGQIEQQGYLKDFDICFVGIGDAYCDSFPLQICDFAFGGEIDNQLKKLFLEGGGGGQCRETYELAAYYFNRFCNIPNAETPFFFFLADESPYSNIDKGLINDLFGVIGENCNSRLEFEKLFEKFKNNVYLLQNPYGGTSCPNRSVTEQVLSDWKRCFGSNIQNIVAIKNEKSVVDVILGIIAMTSNSKDLDSYKEDMKNRGQTEERVNQVESSLESLGSSLVRQVDVSFPISINSPKAGRRF